MQNEKKSMEMGIIWEWYTEMVLDKISLLILIFLFVYVDRIRILELKLLIIE